MSSPELASSVQRTLHTTAGAIFLGVVGAAAIFGITSLQTLWYYHYYRRDSSLHKVSVGVLWVLDALHLALTIQGVYHYIIDGFGNAGGLDHIVWSIKLQVAINVVIILMIQSLYAFRVWLLSGYHHGILGYMVVAAVTGGFVIGIVVAYEIYTVDSYSKLGRISWAINASLATSTSIDFIIAGAMCYYLRISKGTESHLNSRISTVIQYSLSSGLFTSACSLSALFTYILLPNTLVFLALEFLLTKLYISSFLAMLNAREREQKPQDESSFGSLAHVRFHPTTSFPTFTLPSSSIDDVPSAHVDYHTKVHAWA